MRYQEFTVSNDVNNIHRLGTKTDVTGQMAPENCKVDTVRLLEFNCYVSETFNSNGNDNPVTNFHAIHRLRIVLLIKRGLCRTKAC